MVGVVNALLTLLLLGILVAVAAYFYGEQFIEAPGPLQQDKTEVIPSRAGMTDRADSAGAGVITSTVGPFRRGARVGGARALKKDSDIKAGVYALKPNASVWASTS